MKKTACLCVVFFVLTVGAFAGPFGLSMGMSLDEITDACGGRSPERIDDDLYLVYPEKAHPLLKMYMVMVNEKSGLYNIKAVTDEIRADDYGNEPKRIFSQLLAPLERKYGRFVMIDEIADDAVLTEDAYFMYNLANGARRYCATWTASGSKKDQFDNLAKIGIGIITPNRYSISKACVLIEYIFLNAEDAIAERDDVL